MEIANMSLALLNLLPLPHLDGEAFLHALEPVFKMRSREDLEAMNFELQDDDDPQSLTVRRSTSSSPFRLFFGGVKMGTALMVLVFVSLSAWMMIVMR
jgi:membrane-associated protease RseP (regulator of RpoE activity)